MVDWNLYDEITAIIVEDTSEETSYADAIAITGRIMDLLERSGAVEPASKVEAE